MVHDLWQALALVEAQQDVNMVHSTLALKNLNVSFLRYFTDEALHSAFDIPLK